MFLGMQDDLIALIAESREELESAPCIEFTDIVETDEPVEMVAGIYYVGASAIVDAKQKEKRTLRNSYLEMYVDPVVSNPLRWADMSAEEQQEYRDYRQYLLDFTTEPDWWDKTPMTFDEWKTQGAEENE